MRSAWNPILGNPDTSRILGRNSYLELKRKIWRTSWALSWCEVRPRVTTEQRRSIPRIMNQLNWLFMDLNIINIMPFLTFNCLIHVPSKSYHIIILYCIWEMTEPRLYNVHSTLFYVLIIFIKFLMLSTFPKAVSIPSTTQEYFPKWKLTKCAISQVVTSQVCSSLWEVDTWEITHLGSLGTLRLRSCPWEKVFGKMPNTIFLG